MFVLLCTLLQAYLFVQLCAFSCIQSHDTVIVRSFLDFDNDYKDSRVGATRESFLTRESNIWLYKGRTHVQGRNDSRVWLVTRRTRDYRPALVFIGKFE